MKLIVKLIILSSVAISILSCSDKIENSNISGISKQTSSLELEETLLGEWIAGEIYFPQPPAEVQQDIKDISFQSDNTVNWLYVSKGKMYEGKGRYVLLVDSSPETNPRKLPTLFVAPETYTYPGISSVCLLRLTHLEIDFDARFPVESIGKVLKAKDSTGKTLLFVRKGKILSSYPTNAPDKK